MKTFYMLQYSPEWWEVRRGIPTASNFDKILTPKTMKPSASQEGYIDELIGDRANLDPNFVTDRPMSRAMANGRDMEPEARRWYELQSDARVQQVGFCLTDDGKFGCSPDGLVGETGGLELKCPTMATQVRYLRDGRLPDEYRCQVHGQLIVTGRQWWDFASYAPGLKPFLVRVVPDEFTAKLGAALLEFHARYIETVRKILGEAEADRPPPDPRDYVPKAEEVEETTTPDDSAAAADFF